LLRARLIVNPAAGAGRTLRKWPVIRDFLRRIGLLFEHDLTEAPHHAMELAREAVRKGYELIVSVGGDGTINEVVNGLHSSGGLGSVTLGIISTGTGSDYIRTLGIPRAPDEACRRLLVPAKRVVDLGRVEYGNGTARAERLFVNFAGLGFDAEVARQTSQRFKRLGGMPAYLMGLLSTLASHQNRDISLGIDGELNEKRVCAVVASNGRYGGGRMFVAPQADPGDGLFDVLTIGDVSRPELVWNLPRIYRGTHLTHPKISMVRGREIEVSSRQRMYLQADGEFLGEAPARFTALPSALSVAA